MNLNKCYSIFGLLIFEPSKNQKVFQCEIKTYWSECFIYNEMLQTPIERRDGKERKKISTKFRNLKKKIRN